MEITQFSHLLGLCVVVAVSILGVVVVLRGGECTAPTSGPLLVGYPATRYPAQHLTTSGPLTVLAATQARLVTMYGRLEQTSDSAIWLRIFLQELREIMDTVYRVAVITEGYDRTPALAGLIAELQHIEHMLVEQLWQRILQHDGDAHAELLAGRVATLHLCVRELTSLAEQMHTTV